MSRIKSPCVKICVVHSGTGFCVGCFRTPEEIGRWVRMSDAERDEVMAALPARAHAHKAAHARPSRRRRQRA
ncbi:MAG: DUF1289 domain-containing protein [Alphaproteobacteria bacterium]|nr:DUF1289 domain-containing protein [Alphaproteobacteria bacterium]MDX5370369.1 DUF1289 domain-containing protein [Alphaproteobacteria bacterium]MDX5464884.1 DUF1289 domain-containing protein [Alphaproteobacteria bacterium]